MGEKFSTKLNSKNGFDQETLSRHIGEGKYDLDEQTDGQIIKGRDRDSFI